MKKLQSIISEMKIDNATYKNTNTKIYPNYVNFFYGNNGSGKSTIGRNIKNNIGIQYQENVNLNNILSKI